MMKFALLVFGLFSFVAFAHSSHDWRLDRKAFQSAHVDSKFYPTTKRLSDLSVDENELKMGIMQLSGALPVVVDGQNVTIKDRGNGEGRELARHWLAEQYKGLGFTISADAFSTGSNFMAERKGISGKVLILSSHMDSVYNAGANDDGAGTIAALLIAKALKNTPIKHTLRIIAFDREEEGLIGAEDYVSRFDSTGFIGDVHMEMMAYNSKKDGRFHLIDCDRDDSAFLTNAIMSAIKSLGLPLTRVAACTDRSDHAAFWEQDLPAVVLSENFFGGDGDVCYHQTCDKADARLDYKYAATIATGVANGVVALLQAD